MFLFNNRNNVASHKTRPQRSSVNLCYYKCLLRIKKKLPVGNDEVCQTEYIDTFTIITFAYIIKNVCSSVYMRPRKPQCPYLLLVNACETKIIKNDFKVNVYPIINKIRIVFSFFFIAFWIKLIHEKQKGTYTFEEQDHLLSYHFLFCPI